ncbi:MAG: hypothetical protein H6625_08460 [Bdellovibrionaceae bacterium]|nr:hypothetical protein [Pseudobdellovibrionaceae bacterium]
MKFVLPFLLVFSTQAMASDIVSPQEIIKTVENSIFTKLGKTQLYDFFSSESCLFISGDILLIRNYCEDEDIPAKSYYVISPQWGYHYFYEETLPGDIFLRDVTIVSFPEVVTSYWDGAPLNLAEAAKLIEYLGQDNGPGCWVTNYSKYTKGPHSDCHKDDIAKYPIWRNQSEKLVHSYSLWNDGLQKFLEKSQF